MTVSTPLTRAQPPWPLAPRAPVDVTAPDFSAEAYFPDRGNFGTVRKADYRNRWLILFFYSSDFTFV